MKIDPKTKVYTAIYMEHIQNFPEMHRVNRRRLGLSASDFYMALRALERENKIKGDIPQFIKYTDEFFEKEELFEEWWMVNNPFFDYKLKDFRDGVGAYVLRKIEEEIQKGNLTGNEPGVIKLRDEFNPDKMDIELFDKMSGINLLMITEKGIDYIENILDTHEEITNEGKANKTLEKIKTWGNTWLLEYASERLQELLDMGLDKVFPL